MRSLSELYNEDMMQTGLSEDSKCYLQGEKDMFRAKVLSLAYRMTRRSVIYLQNARARRLGRLPDLEDAVEFGDRWLKKLEPALGPLIYDFSIDEGIGVRLYDLYFPSPLTLSAFKGNMDIIEFWLRHGLGAVTVKTVLRHPNSGNPRPRLQEVKVNGQLTLLNALGLPSEGVETFVETLKHSRLLDYGRPVGFSIGGHSLKGYQETFLKLEEYLAHSGYKQYYYELNISCPNTPYGQDMTRHPDLLASLLMFMRTRSNAVISVKLSPDQADEDIQHYGQVIASVDRTVINVGNATFRRCAEVGLPDKAMSIGGGGLSGPPIYARTRHMVSLLNKSSIPIIATGGIHNAENVLELKGQGVSLVGLATAVVQDPYVIPIINHQLRAHLERRYTQNVLDPHNHIC